MKTLTKQEIQTRLEQYPNWTIDEDALHISLEFEDFKNAFTVMTRIAFEAERLQHHPEWYNMYNLINITISTHEVNAITDKDFELVDAIENILET